MMKKLLAILLSMVLLLSLIACGRTETPEKGTDVPNDQTENNNQQKPNPDPEETIPTDPISKEVYVLRHNEDIVHALLSYDVLVFTNDTEKTNGAVEIWRSHLHLSFAIPKKGENSFDATVGYNKDAPDSVSDYHFSFKLYLREQGIENAEYKAIHTNLVPWLIGSASDFAVYHCPFYDSGLLDIVEVGKTYDTVIAIYENDNVVAWGEDDLTWYEDSQNFVEQAEQHADVIIK